MAQGDAKPGPSVSQGPSQELLLRTGSAVLLGGIALAAALVGGWLMALAWALAGAAVAAEWTRICGIQAVAVRTAIVPGAVALAGLLASQSAGMALIPLAAAGAIAALWPGAMRDRAWSIGGIAVGGVLAVVPVLARQEPTFGLAGVLWMFAVVWTADIAAFFIGRTVGGPKLWPRVSPKKTWSGFVGGAVAGTGIGIATFSLVGDTGVGAALVVASVLATIVSQAGDLAESALKRYFGVKDSSRIIPGHGGFMDRLDGFWAVCLLVALWLMAQGAWR